MSKGTIVYIGGFELPDKNAAAQRVVSNAKLLREIGYDVVLIGVHKGSNKKKEQKHYYGFKSYSVQYPESKIEWLKNITEFKFYKEIAEKSQDLHSFIFYNLPAISMARLLRYAKRNNIKTFADCTEWYEVENGFNFRNIIKKIDVKLRMEYFHKKLTGVISISRFLYEYYQRNTVNTILLPPLVDIKDSKWKMDSNGKDFSEPIRFIYVGSPFAITKNVSQNSVKDRIDLIIECLYNCFLNGYRFVFNIVGLTKANFLMAYPTFEHIVKEMEGSLVFHGRIPHLEAIKLLKDAHYSIFFRDNSLTTNAGFPTKLTEAITASTAVITNNSSNIDEFLRDRKNGFILNNISKAEIDKLMNKVFKLSEEEQKAIQFYTYKHNDLFDYRNYESKVQGFIEQ